MIPTTYTIVAQRGVNYLGVDLERGAFGPNEALQAEAFAQQLLASSKSDSDESKRLDRVFVMKNSVYRVFGTAPVHPEDRKEGG